MSTFFTCFDLTASNKFALFLFLFLLLFFCLLTGLSVEEKFQTGRLLCGMPESHAKMTHLNVDVEILIFVDFLFSFFALLYR